MILQRIQKTTPYYGSQEDVHTLEENFANIASSQLESAMTTIDSRIQDAI